MGTKAQDETRRRKTREVLQRSKLGLWKSNNDDVENEMSVTYEQEFDNSCVCRVGADDGEVGQQQVQLSRNKLLQDKYTQEMCECVWKYSRCSLLGRGARA